MRFATDFSVDWWLAACVGALHRTTLLDYIALHRTTLLDYIASMYASLDYTAPGQVPCGEDVL